MPYQPYPSKVPRIPPPREDFFEPDLSMEAPQEALPLRLLLTREVLAQASLPDLLEARGLIESHLPPASLKELDLERELVLQKMALENLQARTIFDPEVSPQHKAQIANALSTAIANLVKVEGGVYDATRFKQVEAILLECLQSLPEDTVQAFNALYRERLGEVK